MPIVIKCCLLTIVCGVMSTMYSQQLVVPDEDDSSLVFVRIDRPDYGFLEETHLIPLPFAISTENSPAYLDGSLAFPSQSFYWTIGEKKIDLDAPWKLELARRNEHTVMYTILGSVNFGGAMYLAYKYIHKNGLK